MTLPNLFFLFVIIMQQIPGVSPFDRWVVLMPWGMNLVAIAILHWSALPSSPFHHQSSSPEPSVQVYDYDRSEFRARPVGEVRPGNMLCVRQDERVPLDLVCLSTSERQAWCMLNCAILDGSEALRIGCAPTESASYNTPALLSSVSGSLTPGQQATLHLTFPLSTTTIPLTTSHYVPQGARLMYSAYLYGLVVHAHDEPRQGSNPRRDALSPPTQVEHTLDILMRVIIAGIVVVSFFSAIGGIVTEYSASEHMSYLLPPDPLPSAQAVRTFFKTWLAFLIGFANVLPIWLPFLLALTKRILADMVRSDLELFTDDAGGAQVREPVLDELGSVDYVVLGKSGISHGELHLAHVSVAGTSYAKTWDETQASSLASVSLGLDGKPNLSAPHTSWATLNDRLCVLDRSALHSVASYAPGYWGRQSPGAAVGAGAGAGAAATDSWTSDKLTHEFLVALAVCHTAIPYWNGDRITYQGTSPDEVAAVSGAAQLGYRLIARQPAEIFVNYVKQETERFEVLYLLPYDAERKVMSVVVRCTDGKIRLYVKGADQVVFPRLAPTTKVELGPTLRHLHAYALDGLRTMVYATREVPEGEFWQWERLLRMELDRPDASPPPTEHHTQMFDILMGQSLTLLGATATEDPLADGVAETVQALYKAGLKLIVVSGDQRDTVLSTAVHAKVLDPHWMLVALDHEDLEAGAAHAHSVLTAYEESSGEKERGQFALLLQGAVLDALPPLPGESQLQVEQGIEDLLDALLDLILLSQVVVVPHASSTHKARLTHWLRAHLTARILAVGAGTNDEPMLRAAHIGVGLLPASPPPNVAPSADMVLPEFRMLRKLLLVHGTWSYARISKMILYTLYGTMTMYALIFWFAIQSGWSGAIPIEGWELSMFYTSFFLLPPALAMGLFDQPLNARMLDRYPQLYGSPILTLARGYDHLLNGLVHSAIIYSLVVWGLWGDVHLNSGYNSTGGILGQTLYFSALSTTLLKALVMSNTVNIYTLLSWSGTLISALVYGILWSIIAPSIPSIHLAYELKSIVPRLYTLSLFWFAVLLVPIVSNFRDVLWRFWQRTYRPESLHLVQEVQKLNVHDYKARLTKYQKNRKQVAPLLPLKHRRWAGGGYAFAQSPLAARTFPLSVPAPPVSSSWSPSWVSSDDSRTSVVPPSEVPTDVPPPYPGWTQLDFARSFDSSLARLPQADTP